MPGDTSSSKKKITEVPPRSTTPTGDPPRRVRDLAAGYVSSGVPSRTKDFAARDFVGMGLKEAVWKIKRENDGLEGKYRKLEPTIDDYDCHRLTFCDGRPGDEIPRSYIEENTQLWASKEQFHNDDSLYGILFENLTKDNGKYKDHYIVVYRAEYKNDPDYPKHSSPIGRVYQKDNEEYSIEPWGKWGKNGYLVTHDIEDVPKDYKDKDGKANWEIRFATNGRIMDL